MFSLHILKKTWIPFGVFDADSTTGCVGGLSLIGSLDGVIGGDSGVFELFACEYRSNTWWQISGNNYTYYLQFKIY